MGIRLWSVVTKDLTMMFWGGLWKSFELWVVKACECLELSETYLQDNPESRADDGGLTCDVSEGSKDYQGHLCSIF